MYVSNNFVNRLRSHSFECIPLFMNKSKQHNKIRQIQIIFEYLKVQWVLKVTF